MFAATHDIGKFMRVIFVSKFPNLDRIVVKKVDEFRKQLYLYKFVRFISSWIIVTNHRVLIVVQTDDWLQHFENLVRVDLALKKRKKHSLKNLRCNYTFFILD